MKSNFNGVFRGKKVFLTGHTGFKGSWLTLWLKALGAEVHGYALPPNTQPNLFEAANVADALTSNTLADVRDFSTLQQAMERVRPDIVFHLAAQPLVRLSYREPRETYEINIMGTVNLLEAVRSVDSVRVCQVITSDKCYENHEWVYAYRENDAMGGYDPYSNSKGCVELLLASYRQSFFHPDAIKRHGVSLASTRAGNVIGGGDWAEDRIIPDCVRSLTSGESIEVRNPYSIRPWQHVLEPLSGYLWLAAHQWQEPVKFEGGWNFGPEVTGNINVQSIVEQVLDVWGAGAWHVPDGVDEPLHEANFLKLDITKATSLLAWSPVCSVQAAVTDTIHWYKAFYVAGQDMNAFTVGQIKFYSECAAKKYLPWAIED